MKCQECERRLQVVKDARLPDGSLRFPKPALPVNDATHLLTSTSATGVPMEIYLCEDHVEGSKEAAKRFGVDAKITMLEQ